MSGFSTSKMMLCCTSCMFGSGFRWHNKQCPLWQFIIIFFLEPLKRIYVQKRNAKYCGCFLFFFRKKKTIWVNCSFKVNCNEVEHTMTTQPAHPWHCWWQKPAEKLFPDLKSLSIFFFYATHWRLLVQQQTRQNNLSSGQERNTSPRPASSQMSASTATR